VRLNNLQPPPPQTLANAQLQTHNVRLLPPRLFLRPKRIAMPSINSPNSHIRINVLDQRNRPSKPELIVNVRNLSKKTLLREQSVYLEVRGQLPGNEEETLLHQSPATDLQLPHPTSIRLLNDRKTPKPLGALLCH